MYKQEVLVIIGIFAYILDHLALSLIYKYERHILYLPTVLMLGGMLAANTDIELAPRFLPHTEQSRGRGSKQ